MLTPTCLLIALCVSLGQSDVAKGDHWIIEKDADITRMVSAENGELVVVQSRNEGGGRTVAGWATSQHVRKWSMQLPVEGMIIGVSPEGQLAVVRNDLGRDSLAISYVDVSTKSVRRTVRHGKAAVDRLVGMSPSLSWLCTGSDKSNSPVLFSLTESEKQIVLPGHLARVADVGFSSDGLKAVTVGGDQVKVWKLSTAESATARLGGKGSGIFAMFSADNRKLIIGRDRNRLGILDASTMAVEKEVLVEASVSLSRPNVGFCDNGSVFYVGSGGTIRFLETKEWNVLPDKSMRGLGGPQGRIDQILVDSGSRQIIVKIAGRRGVEVHPLP